MNRDDIFRRNKIIVSQYLDSFLNQDEMDYLDKVNGPAPTAREKEIADIKAEIAMLKSQQTDWDSY